jgi:hypothetical protein
MPYPFAHLLSLFTFLIASVASTPTPSSISASNSTISVDNADANLFCRPALWTDILIFYAGNYIAHAATTKTSPGQSSLGCAITIAFALLFPTSGILRGFRAIFSGAIFAETELRTAARAGALYMVIGPSVEVLSEDDYTSPPQTDAIRGVAILIRAAAAAARHVVDTDGPEISSSNKEPMVSGNEGLELHVIQDARLGRRSEFDAGGSSDTTIGPENVKSTYQSHLEHEGKEEVLHYTTSSLSKQGV